VGRLLGQHNGVEGPRGAALLWGVGGLAVAVWRGFVLGFMGVLLPVCQWGLFWQFEISEYAYEPSGFVDEFEEALNMLYSSAWHRRPSICKLSVVRASSCTKVIGIHPCLCSCRLITVWSQGTNSRHD
jgi:hypothetical protein